MTTIQAVCHDQRTIVNGTVELATERGCTLAAVTQTAGPAFPKSCPVHLNLLDPKTGKAVNLRGKVTRAERREGRWLYAIRWDGLPEILSQRGSDVLNTEADEPAPVAKSPSDTESR